MSSGFVGDDAWLEAQRIEDSEEDYVVASNYSFERHHGILQEGIRENFIKVHATVRSSVTAPYEPSAYELYKASIGLDRTFWTAGDRVVVEQPLVMIKHGRTIYREQWSFLSMLPEDPDAALVRSAVGDSKSFEGSESSEHTTLRTAAATDRHLWMSLRSDPVRKRVNDDLLAAGLAALAPEEAGSWDSYKRYHDSMVSVGHLPIWWVTTVTQLKSEWLALESESGDRARIAAIALGLSETSDGPYYAVELPTVDAGSYAVHKPTTLCGGFPNNYCAILPRVDPGATARLETGDQGLVEAVMVPIEPPRDRSLGAWPVLDYLGEIRGLPPANTVRVKQRLEIGPST